MRKVVIAAGYDDCIRYKRNNYKLCDYESEEDLEHFIIWRENKELVRWLESIKGKKFDNNSIIYDYQNAILYYVNKKYCVIRDKDGIEEIVLEEQLY